MVCSGSNLGTAWYAGRGAGWFSAMGTGAVLGGATTAGLGATPGVCYWALGMAFGGHGVKGTKSDKCCAAEIRDN